MNNLDALINEIYARYDEKKASNLAGIILKRISHGGNYKNIYEYIRQIGLGEIFVETIEKHQFIMDMNEYVDASKAFMDVVIAYSNDILDLTELVQKGINEGLGINIKPQTIEIDRKEIKRITDALIAGLPIDEGETARLSDLDGMISRYSAQLTDEVIQKNAEIQAKSGYRMVIIRTYDDRGVGGKHGKYGDKYLKPCEWCLSKQGTYNYLDLDRDSDVWKRHYGCTCSIDYVNKGKSERVQNYVVKKKKTKQQIEEEREEKKAARLEARRRDLVNKRKKDLEEYGYRNVDAWSDVVVHSVWNRRIKPQKEV